MKVQDLGLIEYSAALTLQERAVAEVASARHESVQMQAARAGADSSQTILGETILVCEHPPVITVGRALGSRAEVSPTTTLPVVEISRGGRATLHLPGQIVMYPILDLKSRGGDLHGYLRLLEAVIIDTLEDFRVRGVSVPENTGVWVGAHKIASIGIAVKNGVTYHGLALNVCCDLKLFSNLSPCGFSSDVMTSLVREMPSEYKSKWKIEEKTENDKMDDKTADKNGSQELTEVSKKLLLNQVKQRLVDNFLEKCDRLGVEESRPSKNEWR